MKIEYYGIVSEPQRPAMSLALASDAWVTVCLTAPDRTRDARDQARQILEAIDAYLAQAGTQRSRLLTAQIWIRERVDFAAVIEVWNAWVDHENPPALSCVGAEMARADILVEIRVTAARPPQSSS